MVQDVANLATVLAKHSGSFTVASYDTSDNYLPQDEFKRDKYSSDTEWYWVPAAPAGGGKRPEAKKLMKPKKDAPMDKVIDFASQSLGGSVMNVEELQGKFKELVAEQEAQKKKESDDAKAASEPPPEAVAAADSSDSSPDS